MTHLNAIDKTALAAQLRWGRYVATRKLGVPGLLAAGAVVALLGLHALYIQPGGARLDATRGALAKDLAALPKPGPKAGDGGMTLHDVQQLRSREQAYSLFEILSQNGLERKHATYRREAEVKGKLRRLTISIALSGSYAGLREAMRKIADQPMVRIESVTIEREKIDSPVVNVDLRVSLLGPDA
ncbi:hypothetical protein [Burkholderia cepacia]|uniref:Uncharacterized protein n=1 Tax=Burkholderia cepacia TaxID=292 RepID=A0ABM6P7R6_BURCE|nr:hypothetical protein [Burkholderia cepacia]AIO28881.1 hypothetical protein DM41_4480 [Burkholderia cepacia ATCC 25416]ALK20927.1 hypothetical protein APZ15_24320 [Burkholderia cepacia ATCC 25416]ASE99004.1 hypothetical protein CEQ23_37685 [Burkholderia cepacia]ATF82729.1 hypothetical protein CO711_36600 [Burkholderia cepacia]MCA8469179.1 hypothetical protein [Burkholderia cepacia]